MEEDNYRVVTALTEKGLQEKVSKLRQEGWEIASGVTFTGSQWAQGIKRKERVSGQAS